MCLMGNEVANRLFVLSPSSRSDLAVFIVSITTVAILLYLVYCRGIPKPIPGIPFNAASAGRFMGDYPEIQHSIKHGRGYRDWLGGLARRHKAPVVQVFLAPFTRPCVVVTDFREAVDIITRRTREFDRSARTAATVRAIVPESLITMTTADPRFKGNKELVRDLMTPYFLNEVSAPSAYNKTVNLINLWRQKARLAQRHPFEAYADLHDAALDIIMAVTFGNQRHDDVMDRQLQALSISSGGQCNDSPPKVDGPITFPRAKLSEEFEAVLAAKEAMRIGFSSPSPYAHIWLLKRITSLGGSFAAKDQLIRDAITAAVKRLDPLSRAEDKHSMDLSCAMDHMILREVSAARKERRAPDFGSGRLRDELFLYILGGHDTTATTLAWTIKSMADEPLAQDTLRKHLHAVFSVARIERRCPSASEILGTPAPYLDAFLEEALRHTRTIPLLLREVLGDGTEILGHQVPKGTTVILNTRSLSFVEPGLDIPEHLRSKSCQEAKGNIGTWDERDMGRFEPMRWLVKTGEEKKAHLADGEEGTASVFHFSFAEYRFDPHAGPALTLGAGPRGCAGRRLAYLELRIVLTMLVWNFYFKQCPLDLSSSDVTEYFTTVPKQCFVRLNEVEY